MQMIENTIIKPRIQYEGLNSTIFVFTFARIYELIPSVITKEPIVEKNRRLRI